MVVLIKLFLRRTAKVGHDLLQLEELLLPLLFPVLECLARRSIGKVLVGQDLVVGGVIIDAIVRVDLLRFRDKVFAQA